MALFQARFASLPEQKISQRLDLRWEWLLVSDHAQILIPRCPN